MKLTEKDYENIAEQVEEGSHFLEYEKGGEMLFVQYELTIDGYEENDYFNGTGAFIETDRYLRICTSKVYDRNGGEKDFPLDKKQIEKKLA